MLHECNAGCTAAFTQSDHLRLLSLDQSNHSYSVQLSVSWFHSSQLWLSLNQHHSSQLTHQSKYQNTGQINQNADQEINQKTVKTPSINSH